jgi:hypothetical protein
LICSSLVILQFSFTGFNTQTVHHRNASESLHQGESIQKLV